MRHRSTLLALIGISIAVLIVVPAVAVTLLSAFGLNPLGILLGVVSLIVLLIVICMVLPRFIVRR